MSNKILIVDDEVHLAKILQFTLEHVGYEVVIAFDGMEAVEKVKEAPPDLIVLDLMLPEIDGYKVAKTLKEDERYRDIPIIILSARDLTEEGIEEPLMADHFMAKPFNTSVLIDTIASLLAARTR